jgi:phosphoenolpyruvate carboxylase
MTEIRPIDLPEKDLPLRADVSLLGSLVGQVLVDQHGQELLDQVEAVRKASIRQRESGAESDGLLDSVLAELPPGQVIRVIQAFASYLGTVNLAEKVHRIRRRRSYERAQASAQRGSMEAVLGELKDQGVDGETVAKSIGELRLQPVFTAHPTEASRRTIQEKEYDIVLRLVERLNPELTPAEEDLALKRIRAAITSSWQTRQVPHMRPTVADELDNILFYLTDILYRVTPVYYEALETAYKKIYGTPPERFLQQNILRFGSWVGGDMDGNPNVTSTTILTTLARQRRVIIKRYVPELQRLARYLSQSTFEIGVSAEVLRQVERYGEAMPEVAEAIPERYRDMPYRCLLRFMARRLEDTLAESGTGYDSVEEFSRDIELIRDSLAANKGQHAGLFGVDRLLRRVRTFGFHLVTLDVRQDALLHRRVIGSLLGCADWEQREPEHRAAVLAQLLATDGLPDVPADAALEPQAQEALEVFRSISTARRIYGEGAIGLFIISMTQGADDVLTALALEKMANPGSDCRSGLDVSPLLETVDDLQAGPGIVRTLLEHTAYRSHLEGLKNRQVIMVGYSDSNKDSGIVASRWALHEAQRQLVATGARQGVDIVFFHGRGGTVSRGGGNLENGILGAPEGTVNGFLRLTEQGEVINKKYGVRVLALRNLELLTGATLAHSMGRVPSGIGTEEAEILDFMATESRDRFRGLVYGDPGFPSYFRGATPLDVIERLNIGSRPASRRSGEGIENLRAIPWVFSWAQVRVGFPGVFGFGTALDRAIGKFGIETVRELLQQRVFFQAMVNDVEMVLGKSEMQLGRRYASLVPPEQRGYFDIIVEEFQLAERRILEVKQLDRLLDDQRVLQRNIRLRNPYVDPLHLLQIDLLRRWRDSGREDDGLLEALRTTVKGIALGIQNTG